jgi:hypothetical protein
MRAVVATLDGRRHSVLVQVAGVVTGGSIHFPEKWTAAYIPLVGEPEDEPKAD